MDLEHSHLDYNSESEPESQLNTNVPATHFQNLTTQELCKLALEVFEEVHTRYKNTPHPTAIEPFGILEDRLQQLKYFYSYIEDVHKAYILRNY